MLAGGRERPPQLVWKVKHQNGGQPYNKVITHRQSEAPDPDIKRTQDGRPIANLSVATSEKLARQETPGERARKDRMAPRGESFNGGTCARFRRELSEEGLQVYLARASCRPANGPTSRARNTYSTEVLLRASNGQFDHRLTAAAKGGGGGDYGGGGQAAVGGDFGGGGILGPAVVAGSQSGPGRRLAAAG